MSGVITGMGTTYNLPNYTGALFCLSPIDFPFFTAIGGLSGGGQSTSTEIEWQGYDLRAPAQRVAAEGADAPTAQQRVRGNFTNMIEIHQDAVSVSYSKLAAVGLKAGSNNDLSNPVTNELDTQVAISLKEMMTDIEFAMINGVYNKPSDNTTNRQTRGIINAASSSNATNQGTAVTGLSASTDTVTETSTALVNDDKIVFTSVGAASAAISVDKVYYVVSKGTNSFKVAATQGGAPITIGTATVAYNKPSASATTLTVVDDWLQKNWDNGGLRTSMPTLLMGAKQKRVYGALWANAYGKLVMENRNIAGVNLKQVETDFGVLNLMLHPNVPKDAIVLTSLDACAPVFLETPGKGHFFAEPLAKVGASEKVMLYGEVGLAYGPDIAHGVLRGLAL